MIPYSVKLKYQIFVKGYGLFVFDKNMGKNMPQMHSKLLQNEQFQKQQKQLVI